MRLSVVCGRGHADGILFALKNLWNLRALLQAVHGFLDTVLGTIGLTLFALGGESAIIIGSRSNRFF